MVSSGDGGPGSPDAAVTCIQLLMEGAASFAACENEEVVSWARVIALEDPSERRMLRNVVLDQE